VRYEPAEPAAIDEASDGSLPVDAGQRGLWAPAEATA
jgi:hypothetical protein